MGKALDHKNRVLAALAAKETAESDMISMEDQPVYQQAALQLQAHMHALGAIKSTQTKIERKAEFLPSYDAYVEGILAADNATQDDVFMTILVWCIDCGHYARAMEMAAHALKHDLKLPERFQRDLPALLVEEITVRASDEDGPTLDILLELEALTDEADMHDQVRAKLYKAIGARHEQADQLEKAVKAYETAIAFDEQVGVKTAIKKLTKKIEDQKPKDK